MNTFLLVTDIILYVLATIIIIASCIGSVKDEGDDSYVDFCGLLPKNVWRPGARQIAGFIVSVILTAVAIAISIYLGTL